VPVPRAASLTALNEQLLEGCRRRFGDRLRGHEETIGERLVRDLAVFHAVPASPYDACEKKPGRVSSLSLVRYRGTDYSVPTAYGHREVVIRGYVQEVVISCGAEVIARHPRSYEREDFVFNPLHYLGLLEHKIGALDQAAPLVGWDLPGEFATLRRLIEARMAKRGKREFVQILRLLEVFRPEDVLAGVKEAIARGAIGFDAVKHLVLCRIERRPPRLLLDGLSLPAEGERGDDLGQGLSRPARRRLLGCLVMSDTPQLLLAHHLKALKLPTFLREYDKIAQQCAAEGVDHPRYLLRLAELELIERGRRMVERRIKEARFPTVKSLDSFDFTAIPSLNKTLVLELARCEYIARRENVIAVGNSGTGKSHIALGLGLAACQKGLSVGFTTAAAMVHELIEARDEKRLLRLQRQLAAYKLLIIDELGYVPLSTTGAELLFEVFSQRYERGSTLVTSNLPFDEWTGVFGSERLTGALLDRLTHHVRILEMNGDSYRLKQSKQHQRQR
jgi:DNA replication protein DnaC